jgi:hypothetical protein
MSDAAGQQGRERLRDRADDPDEQRHHAIRGRDPADRDAALAHREAGEGQRQGQRDETDRPAGHQLAQRDLQRPKPGHLQRGQRAPFPVPVDGLGGQGRADDQHHAENEVHQEPEQRHATHGVVAVRAVPGVQRGVEQQGHREQQEHPQAHEPAPPASAQPDPELLPDDQPDLGQAHLRSSLDVIAR